MRIKRFTAPTLPEAILEVKREFGKEAVILHTRKYKQGGFLGFFARDMVEITAAIDKPESLSAAQDISHSDISQPIELKEPARTLVNQGEIRKFTKEMTAKSFFPKSSPEPAETKSGDQDLTLVHEEIKEMKAMMNQVLKGVNPEREPDSSYPPSLVFVYKHLRRQGVDRELAKQLLISVADCLSPQEIENIEEVQACLVRLIQELLLHSGGIQFDFAAKRQVVCFVGPTGVGKTTTIAKLAAQFSLMHKKKVALITLDTYRIAAIEQLKTYGSIIGIPVEVVFTQEHLQASIDRHADKDLILVDTAGRSPNNNNQMDELKTFFGQDWVYDNYLVLSASTRFQDMVRIYDSFSVIPIHYLIFTKLDETAVFGAILNMLNHTGKSLAYITNGQSVPDDIEEVNSHKLARLIVGQVSGEVYE